MNDYNEYINVLKGRLKNYRMFKKMVSDMTADIATQEEMLARAMDLGAPIAAYDSMPHGGSELTTVERQTEDRLRVRENIRRTALNRDETQLIIDQLDRTLMALSPEEEELPRGY